MCLIMQIFHVSRHILHKVLKRQTVLYNNRLCIKLTPLEHVEYYGEDLTLKEISLPVLNPRIDARWYEAIRWLFME